MEGLVLLRTGWELHGMQGGTDTSTIKENMREKSYVNKDA